MAVTRPWGHDPSTSHPTLPWRLPGCTQQSLPDGGGDGVGVGGTACLKLGPSAVVHRVLYLSGVFIFFGVSLLLIRVHLQPTNPPVPFYTTTRVKWERPGHHGTLNQLSSIPLTDMARR